MIHDMMAEEDPDKAEIDPDKAENDRILSIIDDYAEHHS
jgi:hypothetical protein